MRCALPVLGVVVGCGSVGPVAAPDTDDVGPADTDVAAADTVVVAPDSEPPEDGETDASVPVDSDVPADTDVPVRVRVVATPVACADPARRLAAPFDRVELPGEALPPDGQRLQGGAVIVTDLDGDARDDVVRPGHAATALWRSLPAGGFEPAPLVLPVGLDLAAVAAGVPGDLDGDGDLDLVLVRWRLPPLVLLRAGDAWVDGTPGSGLDVALHGQAAALGDLDGDGDLDLFVGGYGERPPSEPQPVFPPADPSQLWENDGTGRFVDRSDQLTEETRQAYAFNGAWQDLDGDRRPELIVVDDFGWIRPGRIYWNRPGGLVADDGSSGFSRPFAGMGLGIGDVDDDLVPDFVQSSNLMISLLATFGTGRWYEVARQRHLAPVFTWTGGGEAPAGWDNPGQSFGWGTELVDLDLDGDLDVPMVFGAWDDYTSEPAERDAIFEQEVGGGFVDRGPAWGFEDRGVGRGLAVGDLNDDGWPDLVVGRLGAPTLAYVSRCGEAAWLRVRLRGPAPNTGATGARVLVSGGGRRFVRWVRAGGTGMYGASSPDALVGLGGLERVDVEILWPDGLLTTLVDVPTRQRLDVVRAW